MSHDGAKLHLIRTATGANKPDFADRLGVTVRTLSRWERGQVPVPDDVLAHTYEHLDLVLDVIDHQRQEDGLTVAHSTEHVPDHLADRGVDVRLWNTCLAFCLIDSELNSSEAVQVGWADR